MMSYRVRIVVVSTAWMLIASSAQADPYSGWQGPAPGGPARYGDERGYAGRSWDDGWYGDRPYRAASGYDDPGYPGRQPPRGLYDTLRLPSSHWDSDRRSGRESPYPYQPYTSDWDSPSSMYDRYDRYSGGWDVPSGRSSRRREDDDGSWAGPSARRAWPDSYEDDPYRARERRNSARHDQDAGTWFYGYRFRPLTEAERERFGSASGWRPQNQSRFEVFAGERSGRYPEGEHDP